MAIVTPKTETVKEAKEAKEVKWPRMVKNITDRALYLESGRIGAGEEALASQAEVSNMFEFIKLVD
jgi:hypothetical protein